MFIGVGYEIGTRKLGLATAGRNLIAGHQESVPSSQQASVLETAREVRSEREGSGGHS